MSKLEYIYNFKQPLDQELLTSTEIIVRSHILMLEFIQHSIQSDDTIKCLEDLNNDPL